METQDWNAESMKKFLSDNIKQHIDYLNIHVLKVQCGTKEQISFLLLKCIVEKINDDLKDSPMFEAEPVIRRIVDNNFNAILIKPKQK